MRRPFTFRPACPDRPGPAGQSCMFGLNPVRERGIAIGMLLPVMVFLFIVGLAFVMNTTGKHRIVHAELDSFRALYIAEAAVEESFWIVRNLMNSVADTATGKPGWNEDFQLGFGGTPVILTPLLMYSSQLAGEEPGASIDSCTMNILQPTRFPQADPKWYNAWDRPKLETNTLNPAVVAYPGHYDDPSTNLAQGPPKDSFGTVSIEVTVTVNKITKVLTVTRDYKCIDVTPPGNEYALYVRQGPFGNDPTWPKDRQINEEFNSGGKFTVRPVPPLEALPGSPGIPSFRGLAEPLERRLHIKGIYIVDSGSQYNTNFATGNDVMDMVASAQYAGLDPADKFKDAEDALCFGPGVVPPPRCVYHWEDNVIKAVVGALGFNMKKTHLLPDPVYSSVELSFGMVSRYNFINGRRFNSGMSTHRTSLFGENMTELTGIEGRIAARFKQWWIKGWKIGVPGVIHYVKFYTEGGDEAANSCFAPYRPYSAEPPSLWDHLLFGVWKNSLMGLVGITNPLGYTISNWAGWGTMFEKPEMQEFMKTFKACDNPFILQEPGSPEPYPSNSKFDSAMKATMAPHAARKVPALANLVSDGTVRVGGIVDSAVMDFGDAPIEYTGTGILYTEGKAVIRKSVTAKDDLSYVTIAKKGNESPDNASTYAIGPEEKIQFEGTGDIQIEGSVCSTNSLKVDPGVKLDILGNLVVDRIQKPGMKGDVTVVYADSFLDNRFGPAVPTVRGMTYSVEISPSVSSWVDMSRAGK